ncbi:flippase [Corallibacter sp.]|uniref:flippase n=1 Tax=Corallibacter sp. TaxID=2038084 RepID=UPI003AB7B387
MDKIKSKINVLKKDVDFVELIKGSFSSLLGKIIGMLFGYIVLIIISNKYGAEGLGLYSLSITVLNIAVLIPKFGLDNGLVRILNETKIKGNKTDFISVIKKTTLFMLLISTIATFTLYLSSNIIATKFFHNEELTEHIKVVSLAVIPITLIVVASSTFQVFKKTFYHMLFKTALINILFAVILLVNIYLIDFTSDLLIMYCFAGYTALIIAVILLKIRLDKSFFHKEKNFPYSLKQILSISFPMMLANSFVLMLSWTNILLLGYFSNEFDVGIYNATERLAELSGLALIAINSIAAPKFAEAYSNNDFKKIEEVTKKSTKMIFLSSVPILLVLLLFGEFLLGFFGPEFTIGFWSLVFLCFGRFFSAISGSVGYILQMTNNQNVFQKVIFLAFIINLVMSIILIPKYGFVGAAIAKFVSAVFWNIILVIIVKKRLGFWSYYIPFVSK